MRNTKWIALCAGLALLACGSDSDKDPTDRPASTDPTGRTKDTEPNVDAGAPSIDGGHVQTDAGDAGSSSDGGPRISRSADAGVDRDGPTPVGNVDESDRFLCEEAASSGSSACSECIAVQCCEVFARCVENLDCFEVTFCSNDCAPGDKACVKACEDKFPGVAALSSALSECGEKRCATACSASR